MAKNQGRNGDRKSQVVRDLPLACSDERAAVEFLEARLWGGHPVCPSCTSGAVYQMKDAKTGQRSSRWLWRCRGCKRQFTIRVNTVFEDSKIPLRHWCYGFWMACASKKGVSAKQIQRQTGVSYEAALFLLHRIRHAMADDQGPKPKLSGVVEADETFVGGYAPVGSEKYNSKTPVMAMVERGGDVRAMTLARVDATTLRDALQENVDRSSTLMTDEASSYRGMGSYFKGGHETVVHSRKEYARGNIHSNTAESFFSILKRGVYGTWHSVSKAHLHRYVSEVGFKWNTRKLEDGERVTLAIRKSHGKRLVYQTSA